MATNRTKEILLSLAKTVGVFAAIITVFWLFSLSACDDGREDVCGVVTEIEVRKHVHTVYIRRDGRVYDCVCFDADLRNFSVGDSACGRCRDGSLKRPK